MVGAVGFEPTTFWSQTRRATKLRYAPMTEREYRTMREVCNDNRRTEIPRINSELQREAEMFGEGILCH
jgi:hypothetical protein